MGHIYYPELNDPTWVKDHYEIQLLSDIKIAELLRCEDETVRRARIKHGIPSRSLNEAHKINSRNDGFSIKNQSVFDGSMLGDACVPAASDYVYPWFSKSNIHYNHLLYAMTYLFDEPENQIKFIEFDTLDLFGRKEGYEQLRKMLSNNIIYRRIHALEREVDFL